MQQLTLVCTMDVAGLAEHVEALRQQWGALLGNTPHVAAAARITAARFSDWSTRPLESAERARVSAYFRAVVRRRVIQARDEDTRLARRRLVTASIEEDLRRGGWDAARAAEEARRVTGIDRGLVGVA